MTTRRSTRSLTGAAALVALALLTPCAAAHAQAPPATDIFLAPLSIRGHTLQVGRPENLTDRAGYDNQPAFTPDGRAILYTAIDAAGQADIYRYDLDARRSLRLTRTSPESEYSATVMPGGRRFSVVRVEADSTQRLWSFDLSGRDPRLVLPTLRPVGYYAWADDHTLVLYVLGTPATLHVDDARTGADRTVARDIGRSIQKVPGRHAVSFVQHLSAGRTRIDELNLDTGAITPLIETRDGGDFHVWTPDSTLLMGHGSQLLGWRRGQTGWHRITDLAGSGIRDITRLAVSPDARRLAIVAAHPR